MLTDTDKLEIIKFAVGLFAILNAIGIAPMYLALTEGNDAATRRRRGPLAADDSG